MADGSMRDELRELTRRALSGSHGAGQAEAMALADRAVKEFSRRPDAVHQATAWVEAGAGNSDPWLLWSAGAVLENVAGSSKLWLQVDAKMRNYSCVTLLRCCRTCELLKHQPFIAAKVQRALGNQVIHEWPENFPEFAPEVNQGFSQLSAVVIQLAVVVLNRAAEIAVGRGTGRSFRKFGSVSMSNREKLQAGLREIVPFLFGVATASLRRLGEASAHADPNESRAASKAVMEAISECVKISEENAVRLQVDAGTIQSLFDHAKRHPDQQGLALECVAEVTSQSSIAAGDEACFVVVLRELISSFQLCKQKGDEDLARALVNISCILTGKHITRLETSQVLGPALVQLLQEVFQLAFESNSASVLLQSLDVWEVILEHVESERDVSYGRGQNQLGEMYKSCNLAVAQAILRRLFLYTPEGGRLLAQIDDTPGSALESLSELQLQEHSQGRDVSDFSELDHFHSRCEEIFGLLLDIYPSVLLPLCARTFEEVGEAYGSALSSSDGIFKCGQDGIKTVSHDLSTCLRIVTRCAPKLAQGHEETSGRAFLFVTAVCGHVLSVCEEDGRLRGQGQIAPGVAEYADLNGKLAYNCLSMFTMWVRQLAATPEGKAGAEEVVRSYLDASVRCFELSAATKAVPSSVLISAAGALSSFSMVVQPSLAQLQGLQSFQRLLGLLQCILATAPQRAASSIWVFLADSLMKRVDPKQKDQDHLAQIEPEFSRLVAMPAELLARASSSGLDPTTLGQTQSAAHSLCALVRSFGGKSHAARVLLCKCVSPVLPACVSLVRQIAQRPSEHTGKAAQNAINLLVACFDVISKEMPEEFISGTVKDFIAMYSDPAAVKALSVDTGSSLLELLTLLARRPGQKFKQLSVQTVEWCLSVWPGLAPGGGITHADLLQLLCRVLRHQWRACAPQHVQGVLALMVQCFHALDPSAVQRFLLDEIVKLDEQTKFFCSPALGADQGKGLFTLACSLLTMVEVRPDLQEVLLSVLYRIPREVLGMAAQQRTADQGLLRSFLSKNPRDCAEFSRELINFINDASFLASLA